MIVKDIAICNPKNNYIPNSFINYIDTASVLDGKIKNIQKLGKTTREKNKQI